MTGRNKKNEGPGGISRRGFIVSAAAGSVGFAQAAKAGGGITHFSGYPGRMGLLHDTTLCVGCRSCEAACRAVNEKPVSKHPIDDKKIFNTKRRPDEVDYTVVNLYQGNDIEKPAVYRKHQCMHCNEPCCASVCFVDAFKKTPEGPVLYDEDLCVGCRYCLAACPYNALAYEYKKPFTPLVVRCTMCYSRIKKGLNPGCADACPTGAITFGRREELIKVARERIRKVPDRYIDHLYGEHEWGGTSWMILAGIPFGQLDLFENIGPQPIPDLSTSFLAMAPLVAALFPGMLAGFYAFSKRKDKLSKKEHDTAVKKIKAETETLRKQELKELTENARLSQEREVERAVKRALIQAGVSPQAKAQDEEKGETK